MALQPYYDGPVLVRTGTGSSSALEDLGYTENGPEIDGEAFWLDVHGDQRGGDAGPPIDVQYIGEIVKVRLVLTRYDTAVLDKVICRLLAGTAGVTGTPGTLMFEETKYVRLLLSPTSRPRNFVRAILRGVFGINKGTKHSKPTLDFECHADGTGAGTIWNTTTA